MGSGCLIRMQKRLCKIRLTAETQYWLFPSKRFAFGDASAGGTREGLSAVTVSETTRWIAVQCAVFLFVICFGPLTRVSAAANPHVQSGVLVFPISTNLSKEFIYEKAPFPSAH